MGKPNLLTIAALVTLSGCFQPDRSPSVGGDASTSTSTTSAQDDGGTTSGSAGEDDGTTSGMATGSTSTSAGTSSGGEEGDTTSSDETTGGSDMDAPQAEAFSPVQNGQLIDGATPLVVTFDEPLAQDPDFELLSNGVAVAGSLELEGATLRFAPDEVLVDGAYTATISGVSDEAGNVAADIDWAFEVPEGAWDTDPLNVDAGASYGSVDVVSDATGNFTAVWLRDGQAWSAVYRAGAGWDAATQIDAGSGTVSDLVVRRMGSEVIAGWRQGLVHAAIRGSDGVWADAVSLAPGSAFDLAANENGQAVFVLENDGNVNSLYFDDGEFSGLESVAITDGMEEVSAADVAIDPDGRAITVFRRLQFPGPNQVYWSASRSDVGIWTTAGSSLGTSSAAGWAPTIAADRDGYFTFVVPNVSPGEFCTPLDSNCSSTVIRRNAAGDTQAGTSLGFFSNFPAHTTVVRSGGDTIVLHAYNPQDSFNSPGTRATAFRSSTGGWSSVELIDAAVSTFAGAAGLDATVALLVDGGSVLVRYCDSDGCFDHPAVPVPGVDAASRTAAALNDDGLGVVLWNETGGDGQDLQSLLFRGRAGL